MSLRIRSCLGALFFLAAGTWAAELTLAEPGGLKTEAFKLQFHSPPGANVYFTTDGSVPTINSPRYQSAVTISNTTIVRAAALGQGKFPSVVTRTYIFPGDVVRQDGKGFPITWGSKDGKAVPAYYEMARQITEAPEYRDVGTKSLEALPSLSIVIAPEELFGAGRGIYTHPEETGEAWERACSFELIQAGKTNVEMECGIRIQGGWNRRPEESPKHSFRLIFRKKYGAGKLHYPLFGEDGPGQFNCLILRAGCNNSWLHWSGVERHRGELIRDQWVRDSLREMGQPSAAGLFVHLYLNGLYWGIYNLTERPDAAFAAAHLGGAAREYDSFNADKVLSGSRDGWNELMSRLKKDLDVPVNYAAVGEMLDLQNFADYMIVNLYGANADWDRGSNWYAARRNQPPGKFRFFVWDAERTLESPTDNTIDFSDDQSPPGIFHQLIGSEEFRKYFAERARLHLTNNGALTPKRCAERYKKWADRLDLAIVGESARWGDYRRDIHPYKEGPYELYTRDNHWRPEVQRLLREYFPNRTGILIEQFRAKGLY